MIMPLSVFIHGLILASLIGVSGGCSDPTYNSATEKSQADRVGFMAQISGAVSGEASGAGIVTYLPPKEEDLATGRSSRGYYVLANNLLPKTLAGKDVIITFRIPDGVQTGQYAFKPSDPLKIGKDIHAQIEIVEGGESVSYHSKTEGTLTFDQFSPVPAFPDISNSHGHIKGHFQFAAENADGERVSVNGDFNFPHGNEVMA